MSKTGKETDMEYFFHETIANWQDWARVFQSREAFAPLVEEICRREGLKFVPLRNLTPGTNAVFRMGKLVAKVFFPKESGLDPVPDFENEAAVCGWLTERGVSTPRLLAKGYLEDKYRFYYIVTEYAQGKEAGDWLPAAGTEEKAAFVRKLSKILETLNVPAEGLIRPIDLRERALCNPRLAQLPEALQEELRERARELDLSLPVLVHGDLTGENILVSGGEPVIIDCADACLAPAWYEYGPLAVELFRCDPFLLGAFARERPDFLERLPDCMCIHDFGPDLLREAAKRAGRPPFSSLREVREFFSAAAKIGG